MRNRTVGINVRVTPAEKHRMESAARRCGLTLSEYLRQRALGYTPQFSSARVFVFRSGRTGRAGGPSAARGRAPLPGGNRPDPGRPAAEGVISGRHQDLAGAGQPAPGGGLRRKPEKTEYGALSQALHYAGNDAKTTLTESAKLVSGIHCRPETAWADMRAGTAEVRQNRGRGGDARLPEFPARRGNAGTVPRHRGGAGPAGVGAGGSRCW